VRPATASRWSRTLALAERRLPALTRLKRAEALPIVLHRRRIYVVPSRFGLTFSLILMVMLLGALNYNNNPALLLTCLLGAAAYQSVFAGFRAMNRVELRSLQAQACSAGETLRLSLFFQAPGPARHGLRLRLERAGNDPTTEESVFDITADGKQTVETELAAPRRGLQRVGRIRVWSEYPFGLFHVWSWLNPDFFALIYPRAEMHAPPLPDAGGQAQAAAQRRSDDELGTLRDYHASDARRMIAWKASARHDHLLVKEFEQRRGQDIVLDWRTLDGLDFESRISRLAAWVVAAETSGTPYLLALPHARLGPASGAEHRHACLRELALMPGAGA
jgi:uncharacterized protein (DUF58 family)